MHRINILEFLVIFCICFVFAFKVNSSWASYYHLLQTQAYVLIYYQYFL